MASNDWLVNPFCKDVNIDCDTYWKNRVGFFFIKTLEDTNVYVDGKLTEGHRALPWVALLGFLFWVVYQTKDQTEDANDHNVEKTSDDFVGISLLPSFTNRIQKQIPRYGTALLVVVFSFTTTAGCFPLLLGGGEAESGTPIWLLGLGNGIPADTQSVADEPGQGGSGGGGTSTGNARVEGMYFFHPDHLGSITMITDGHGNVLAGGERGGKSHITYKPYGEIFRTDSYGPDITKFKYTGQEEDQESGLYYYKARYYDASLGRFVSNDGQVFPDKEQGMNRMMYVDGNPLKWADRSGNRISQSLIFGLLGYILAPEGKKIEGFLTGYSIGKKKDLARHNNDIDKNLRGILGKSDFRFEHLKRSDFGKSLNQMYKEAVHGDIGNWITERYTEIRYWVPKRKRLSRTDMNERQKKLAQENIFNWLVVTSILRTCRVANCAYNWTPSIPESGCNEFVCTDSNGSHCKPELYNSSENKCGK
ncbi:RHS repeat domain-containing protein [Leptospira vanthielii]|nr:RHS repeat-associated core domain-containing protein [Leptospira vanthielii]